MREVRDEPGGASIVAEERSPNLDRELRFAWLQLHREGTRRLHGTGITDRIHELSLRPKSGNIAGLQLADLVVSPIGRFVIGKPIHQDFRIVESKFSASAEGYIDSGLVILPKE